jgi:dephospho-CoA kinase
MTLTTITEDATANAGQTVASIIASAGGDRITDVGARLRLWMDQNRQRASEAVAAASQKPDLRKQIVELKELREQLRRDPNNLHTPSGETHGRLKPETQAEVAKLTKQITELEQTLATPAERFPKFKK